MLSPFALIDLLAILPFYIPASALDFRSFRAVRLFRVLRIARLGRYSEAMRLTGRVVTSKRAELLSSAFIMAILMLFASSLMYFAERDAQPENFSSIPAAMWWAVATLSTVGYGDIYPLTAAGKLLASVIALLGIGMFALPTGILGAGFVEEIQRRREAPRCCPKCGVDLTGD
jgi:voltage-gated potassium channel